MPRGAQEWFANNGPRWIDCLNWIQSSCVWRLACDAVSIFTNLLGGPWLYLAAFLAGSAAGAAGGYKAKDWVDSPKISRLQVDWQKAQTEIANGETRFKTREAQIEADRAEVNRKALEGIQAQAAESARLRGELALAERARQMASRALTAALRRAEADKVSNALSPAALAYLASVRAEQAMP